MKRCDAWQRVYCNFEAAENTEATGSQRRNGETEGTRVELLHASRWPDDWSQAVTVQHEVTKFAKTTRRGWWRPMVAAAGSTVRAVMRSGGRVRLRNAVERSRARRLPAAHCAPIQVSTETSTSTSTAGTPAVGGVGSEANGLQSKAPQLAEVFSTGPVSFTPTAHRAVPADAAVEAACSLRVVFANFVSSC